jgi:hypothetical protein
MKNTLWLFLIIACLLGGPQNAVAFDPGAWLSQEIMKIDRRAAEDAVQRGETARKEYSSRSNHSDTMRRLKKYLKTETGKTSRH